MEARARYLLLFLLMGYDTTTVPAQTGSLNQLLRQVEPATLAREVRLRGDAKRGALVFYTSAAGCVKCHTSGADHSPLGPNLAELGADLSDEYLIDALIHPSKEIRKGYETLSICMVDGTIITGLKVAEQSASITIREVTDLQKETAISKQDIEEVKINSSSMRPAGLIDSLRDQREFYDLARYVLEVAQGGIARARELNPKPAEIAWNDDSVDLNHAGLLRRLTPGAIKAGGRIFHDSCISCHGSDGTQATHPAARAFGKDKLKFGADPYSMFLTLTHGNGLMAPVRHLAPLERYQVIAYVRERFMKGRNPDYRPVDEHYLKGLPIGTRWGEPLPVVRDYGPVIASALGGASDAPYGAVAGACLSVDLGDCTLCFDLHRLDQVQVWTGGLLDFNNTLYGRMGGLRLLPRPAGKVDPWLAGWQWGHDGELEYPQQGLLPRGPLPLKWLDYRGRYLFGKRLILSYRIDGRELLESPTSVDPESRLETAAPSPNLSKAPTMPGLRGIRHTLRLGPGKSLVLAVATPPPDSVNFSSIRRLQDEKILGLQGPAVDTIAIVGKIVNGTLTTFAAATVMGDCAGLSWQVDQQQRLVLSIPNDSTTRQIEITRYAGDGASAIADLRRLVRRPPSQLDWEKMRQGGPARWSQSLTTIGYTGLENGPYVLDTICPPESTPWNSWFQTTAIDFLSDGRMVLATHGGEIWLVSGIDQQLLNLRWKRFAAGLYEPMGLKVVDDVIYVTGKDGITRLHDRNADDEADFYECFSPDDDVSARFHAFNFDLQRDLTGHFYYAKSGQYTNFTLPGAVLQISADGKQRRIWATGFRTPNGMGMLPDGRITVSDNQGFWIPASKISIVKEGGFYGYVRTSDDGQKSAAAPADFAPPIIWMPQELDNSSGGQLWVDDTRWGPLAGHLLHTSYGKGWLYYLMLQEVEGETQSAIIRLPHHFQSGIIRAAVDPVTGQLFVVGLQGWNENGRPNLRENCIQRLRYTGQPLRMITHCQVIPDGLQIDFNFPLHQEQATDLRNWVGKQWNYLWSGRYGSLPYSPDTRQPGKDAVNIKNITLSEDNKSVILNIPNLQPVHQMQLQLNLTAEDGEPFQEEVYWTIHRIPKLKTP